jgi:hypothetical protein
MTAGSVGVRGSSPLSSTHLTRPFSFPESGFRRSWCQRGGHWSPSRCGRVPQCPPHSVRRVLAEFGHHMAVRVCRGPHLRVAEDLHDDPWVYALGQQQRHGGVPAVVQPHLPREGPLPFGQLGSSRAVVGERERTDSSGLSRQTQ